MQNQSFRNRIEKYWSARAEAFGQLRAQELSGGKAGLWKREMRAHIADAGSPLKILDVGTGAGFLAILLAKEGHNVTGIDVSQKMLDKAASLAAQHGCSIDFIAMDVCAPDFGAESFDCVVGRNVTWTLPDPERAYCEWHRILKPGGILLNFDADYGAADFVELHGLGGKHAHSDIPFSLVQECETIRKELPLSRERRPQWDMDILRKIGFSDCFYDNALSERIFAERDATYNPVPMFAISGRK